MYVAFKSFFPVCWRYVQDNWDYACKGKGITKIYPFYGWEKKLKNRLNQENQKKKITEKTESWKKTD